MDPSYCQTATPMFALAGSTCVISLYYGQMALKEPEKPVVATFASGAALFMIVAAALLARGFDANSADKIEMVSVDECGK